MGWFQARYAFGKVSSVSLRHNSRPDDGPVQGPKHVVLVINITPPLLVVF